MRKFTIRAIRFRRTDRTCMKMRLSKNIKPDHRKRKMRVHQNTKFLRPPQYLDNRWYHKYFQNTTLEHKLSWSKQNNKSHYYGH